MSYEYYNESLDMNGTVEQLYQKKQYYNLDELLYLQKLIHNELRISDSNITATERMLKEINYMISDIIDQQTFNINWSIGQIKKNILNNCAIEDLYYRDNLSISIINNSNYNNTISIIINEDDISLNATNILMSDFMNMTTQDLLYMCNSLYFYAERNIDEER